MNDRSELGPVEPVADEQRVRDVDLLDYLAVLIRNKRFIVRFTLRTAFVAALIAVVLPTTYTATARVVPPPQTSNAALSSLSQLSDMLGALSSSSVGIANPSTVLVGYLSSRTIADAVIERLNLRKVYEGRSLNPLVRFGFWSKTRVDLRSDLDDVSTFIAGEDGIVAIEIVDPDPVLAAEIANAFAAELERMSRALNATDASHRRKYLSQQAATAAEQLAKAEEALQRVQERTGLIRLDDQAAAIIQTIASIKGQISAKELELASLRTFSTERHPDYVRVQKQLESLQKDLAHIEKSQIAGKGDVFVPTARIPEAGIEYARRYRDVRYYTALHESISQQLELAKLMETTSVPSMGIVDVAVPPDKKSGPPRTLIVVLGLFVGFFLAVLFAFARDALSRIKTRPESAHRFQELAALLRWRS